MGTDSQREKYGVKVLAYGHAQDNENKIYQVLEIESMEKMQEGLQDPEIAKLRTDAGVNLDSQEVVFLVEWDTENTKYTSRSNKQDTRLCKCLYHHGDMCSRYINILYKYLSYQFIDTMDLQGRYPS